MPGKQHRMEDYVDLWKSDNIQSLDTDAARVSAIAKALDRTESNVRTQLKIGGVQFSGRKVSNLTADMVLNSLNEAYGNGGGLKEAAESLDVQPSTLSAKIKEFGIQKTVSFSPSSSSSESKTKTSKSSKKKSTVKTSS